MKMLMPMLLLSIALFAGQALADPQVEEFTYQGHLQLNGQPADGTFPMTFALFDASSAGNPVGAIVSKGAVNVNGGSFTVNLSYPGAFTGQQLWLEIAVNGQTLASRQKVTATPVSQFALNGGRAFDYAEFNPSTAATPPQTTLGVTGPFTFSASCGIDSGNGTVTLRLFVDSAANFDANVMASTQANDAGAIVFGPATGSNLAGPLQILYYLALSGNYRRVWIAPLVLKSLGSTTAVVTMNLYLLVDAAATKVCAVQGTAVSGV